MDSSGNIYKIGEEPDAVKSAKEIQTLLNERQAEALKMFAANERHEMLHDMISKNNNSRRRFDKKLKKASRKRAKASRQRNRR